MKASSCRANFGEQGGLKMFARSVGAVVCVCSAVSSVAVRAESPWPFAIVRSYGSLAVNANFTRSILKAQERHPGLVDEVWAGGSCLLDADETFERDVIAANRPLAEELRRHGIAFSFQQGMTFGHGPDGLEHPGFDEADWAVDWTGRRLKGMFCPTAPAAYATNRRFAERVMKELRPVSYWPDDDLRYSKGRICFCERCLGLFSRKTGGDWTREALNEALFGKCPSKDVREAWLAFHRENLGAFARAYREAADAASPECRLGIQLVQSYADYNGRDYAPLVASLSGDGKRPVGLRPGACVYTDRSPREIFRKALYVMNEAARSRRYGPIGQICYESENWPHVSSEKSPAFQMVENALALAAGCDSLALYWGTDVNRESDENYAFYFDTFARWKPFLLALRDGCRGTEPCGVAEWRGGNEAATGWWHWREEDAELRLMENAVPLSAPDARVEARWLTARRVEALAEGDVRRLFAQPVLLDVAAFAALQEKFRETAFLKSVRLEPVDFGALQAEQVMEEVFADGAHARDVLKCIVPQTTNVIRRSRLSLAPDACGTCAIPTGFGGMAVLVQDLSSPWLWTGPRRKAILDALDAAIPGGAAARLLTGGYCVAPIVRTDARGRVKGVFLLNASPGETPPLELSVRCPAGRACRLRTEAGEASAAVVRRRGEEVVLRIPSIPGWRPVWLEFP